jgi:hypothetical protein
MVMKQSEESMSEFVGKVNAFMEGDWKKYQQAVEGASPKIFKSYESLKIN